MPVRLAARERKQALALATRSTYQQQGEDSDAIGVGSVCAEPRVWTSIRRPQRGYGGYARAGDEEVRSEANGVDS